MNFRQGDLVRGQVCPKCGWFKVVYNGNYFCQGCDWVMSKEVPRIIKAYLIQRLTSALEEGNQREVTRLSSYLADYSDVAL